MSDRGGHIMFQLNSTQIVLIGGQDHPLTGRSVWNIEIFNLMKNEWSIFDQTRPKGPLERQFRLNFQIKGHKVRIWAIDFINSGKIVQEYDFTKRKWLSLSAGSVEIFSVSK